MYTYTVLDKKFVFGKLEKGETVLVADFNAMKIIDCLSVTVDQINYFKNSSDTVFFTRTEATA